MTTLSPFEMNELSPEEPTKKKRRKAPEERLTDLNLSAVSPTFNDFAAQFGLNDAIAMTRCGLYRVDRPEKDDPFLDCVNVAISYDCLTVYYEHNGFTSDKNAVRDWVRKMFPFEKYDIDDDSMSKVFKKTFKEYLGM